MPPTTDCFLNIIMNKGHFVCSGIFFDYVLCEVNMDHEKSGEEEMSDQNSINSLCPFIKNPFDICYCTSTSSLYVGATINYCGGNFKKCEIYHENMKSEAEKR